MTVAVFIFLIVFMFTAYQLAALFFTIRETRRIREIRNRTETQYAFGKLRHRLMLLATSEELATESITFLNFYIIQTLVMRNPDRYKTIAKVLQQSFLKDIHDTESKSVVDSLISEKANWTSDTKSMVIQTSEEVSMLMIRHSPLLRTLYTAALLLRKLLMYILKRELGLITSGIRIAARTNRTNRTFIEAKDEMLELAV